MMVGGPRTSYAEYALFSGGHDSLVASHVASQSPNFKGVIHLNTGIGIEETREFVRKVCRQYGWPLHEYHARQRNGMPIYDDMCLRLGMPGGPKGHSSQYHVLKKEGLDHAVKELRGGDKAIVLVTGIRKAESVRRMRNAISVERREELDKHRIWTAPILDMTGLDVEDYIREHNLPENEVVRLLHRSGECLCGALARPEELKEIALWYPDVAKRIRGLERACYEKRLPFAWGSKKVAMPPPEQMEFPLCQSCELRWDVQDDPAEAELNRLLTKAARPSAPAR
jgi:3'-phosphoadenosine 5'-phosphosulfate sulfotransferase (PAPS reductase)/FAD synthetase